MSDLPSPLTDHQKREIVRLKSSGRQHKEIARLLGCTLHQCRHHWWAFLGKTEFRNRSCKNSKKYRIKILQKYRMEHAEQEKIAQHQAACAALRAEIEAARAERATAPIFRIRAEEWA